MQVPSRPGDASPLPADHPGNLLRPHFPALDGLRGFAILAVFSVHFLGMVLGYRPFLIGWVGVDIFFVLSGFLITGGLLDTLGRPGYLRTFYLKRILRIVPLYYAVWAVLLLLRASVGGVAQPHLSRWLTYRGTLALPSRHGIDHLFSIAQLTLVRVPAPFHSIVVAHFWSLCVEEQFYLVWPFALLLASTRRRILLLCLAGIAASLALRLALLHRTLGTEFLYHQSYTHSDGFLMGACIALWIRAASISARTHRRAILALSLLGGLPLLAHALLHPSAAPAAGLLPHPDLSSAFVTTYGLSLWALCSAALLLACLHPGRILRFLFTNATLRFFGKISYGLYIIHDLPQSIFDAARPTLLRHHLLGLAVALWFGLAVLLATLSYHLLEHPFLKLKARLHPPHPRHAPPFPL